MYEELIKRLRDYEESGLFSISPYEAGEAADAIEELSAHYCPHAIRNVHDRGDDSLCRVLMREAPKWIPVTERLPEKNGKYLCNVKRFGQYAGKQYYYVDVLVFQEDSFFEDGIGTERVTHWMPLPSTEGLNET